MKAVTDQTGRTLLLHDTPIQRIISLVPSQTELLFYLGLQHEVAGITKFCIHPDTWFQTKPRVGGTKQLDLSRIQSLAPDLILANKEENVKEQIEALAAHYPVWVTDVNTLPEAYEMIHAVGQLVNRETEAFELIQAIRNQFELFPPPEKKIPACYLIWQEPYMTIGHDTFIHSMLEAAGFENCFGNHTRYPVVSVDDINQSPAELILLSSEPFPFKQKHAIALQAQCPGKKILLADGELFSWYGSRMLQAPSYFAALRKQVSQFPENV